MNLILFGASGNLAKEKIYPALNNLWKKEIKFEKYIGFGRSKIRPDEYKNLVKKATDTSSKTFLSSFRYIQGDYNAQGINNLIEAHPTIKKEKNVFYFSIPIISNLLRDILKGIKENQLLKGNTQVIVEKPFGLNLKQARELQEIFNKYLDSNQIYLIDHYLGKNLVRNILAFRFTNPIIYNLWKPQFIKEIKIQTLETQGIKDRGEYYDKVGAIKDMIQSHLLQLVALLLMEMPGQIKTGAVSKEKLEVLRNLEFRKNSIKINQYPGYHEEAHIPDDSLTETYAKLTTIYPKDGWQNIPITLETGKKQQEKKTLITIDFQKHSECPWADKCQDLSPNQILIELSPNQRISIKLNTSLNPLEIIPQSKELTFRLQPKDAKFHKAYENTLYDIYQNNHIYSPTIPEIIESWKFIEDVEKHLKTSRKTLLGN